MNNRWLSLIGLEITPNNHVEKFVSGLGGFVAIAAIVGITSWWVGHDAAMPVVASMGASAVLLFAVPHGQLSQPWPLVAGHLLSAIVGVTCARYISHPVVAAGAAVGLAVTLMYYARCIHPPGGATALVAVIGGPALRDLGYAYVLVPVAVNVAIILMCAIAFNCCFPWRRYPTGLSGPRPARSLPHLTNEDWAYALSQTESMVDISEEDLTKLHILALSHSSRRPTIPKTPAGQPRSNASRP